MSRPALLRAHAAPLAAALLLAGCSVDVDGAPCRAPGASGDCPGGQACGNDLRCSARALACVASRCLPGSGSCAGASHKELAVRCSDADPVCGREVTDDCAARWMECSEQGGTAACECPEYAGTVLVADPGGSPSRDLPPYPRGQGEPRECRFARLGDALDAAAAHTTAAAVRVAGSAGAPVVFGAEAGPLAVAANVSLVGAPAPAGPTVLRGTPGAATLLAVQGAVEGLTVEAGRASGTGVALSCGASGAPSLRRVTVDGGLDPVAAVTVGLGAGVVVRGSCGARLALVDVEGVAGAALSIEPTAAATVEVLGGRFGGSEVGIRILGGTVRIGIDPEGPASVSVSGNAGVGVAVGSGFGSFAVLDATLDGLVVAGNGGTGLVVGGLSSASRVRILRCDFQGNGSELRSEFTGRVDEGERQVGGALVRNLALDEFAFRGNRLWSNHGDQLAFDSDASFSIAPVPGACGAGSNLFGGLAEGALALRKAGGGTLDASYCGWPGSPPAAYHSAGVTSGAACTTQLGVLPPRLVP